MHVRPMTLLRRFSNYRKKYGAPVFFFLGLKFILRKIFRLFYLRKKIILSWDSLDLPRSETKAEIPISVEPAGLDDVRELSGLKKGIKPAEFRRWIEKGYIINLARANGRIVSFGCLCAADEYRGPEKRFFDLRKDDAWGLDCYTAPDFRGKKIYPAILSRNREIAGARGFKRIVGTIDLHNEASKKVHLSCAEDAKIINCLRILWFKKYWEERRDGESR